MSKRPRSCGDHHDDGAGDCLQGGGQPERAGADDNRRPQAPSPLTARLPVPRPAGNRELLEAPGRLAFTKGLTQLLNAAYC